jgi:adenylylsulfate kinase
MAVIWITGFSGAGKTTVAEILQQRLRDNNIISIFLDGDKIREVLGLTSQYSYEERKEISYKYAKLAKLISDQNVVTIVATISMFEEVRQWNRSNNLNYLEVYLKVSEEVRKSRDPKELYSKASEIMVHSKDNYEEPQRPDLIFEHDESLTPKHIVESILGNIKF